MRAPLTSHFPVYSTYCGVSLGVTLLLQVLLKMLRSSRKPYCLELTPSPIQLWPTYSTEIVQLASRSLSLNLIELKLLGSSNPVSPKINKSSAIMPSYYSSRILYPLSKQLPKHHIDNHSCLPFWFLVGQTEQPTLRVGQILAGVGGCTFLTLAMSMLDRRNLYDVQVHVGLNHEEESLARW